ncbi:MAG: hypothetical protein ABR589_01130 [Chthoniobacterales bacterium]
MKIKYSRFIPAVSFAFLLVVFTTQASAAPPVTISFADGSSVRFRTDRERFYPVGVSPGETANIQFRLPRGLANTRLSFEALDGGVVTDGVVIAVDGTASVTFTAGDQPGLYRLLASASGKTAILQFWVFNAENPEANPPVLVRTPTGN